MIEIEHLRKEYRDLVAVRDLSLRLEQGDIFGFIGPNAAGKTTTIKMLATLLRPTSGCARIDGVDVAEHPEQVRGIIGYMPDFFGVYDDIKASEYLDFFAAAYKIPRASRAAVIDDVLELTDLTGKKDAFVEELSRGMKQRLCLAKTLVHDPKVLLLDEPASGLDPRARVEMKELLKELQRMGKTIIVSSHILPELAEFCNTIGIIEQGEMVASGAVETIMQQVRGGPVIDVRLPTEDHDAALRLLAERADVDDARAVDGEIKVRYAGEPDEVHRLLAAMVGAGLRVQSFREQPADLEDLFMKLTRGIVS